MCLIRPVALVENGRRMIEGQFHFISCEDGTITGKQQICGSLHSVARSGGRDVIQRNEEEEINTNS